MSALPYDPCPDNASDQELSTPDASAALNAADFSIFTDFGIRVRELHASLAAFHEAGVGGRAAATPQEEHAEEAVRILLQQVWAHKIIQDKIRDTAAGLLQLWDAVPWYSAALPPALKAQSTDYLCRVQSACAAMSAMLADILLSSQMASPLAGKVDVLKKYIESELLQSLLRASLGAYASGWRHADDAAFLPS